MLKVPSSLNTDYASFVRKMSNGIRFYNTNSLTRGWTIADDGLITFKDVIVLQGDIVHVAGSSNSPYGSFGATMFKGNYGITRLDSSASNSISPSNVLIGTTALFDGLLTLRITPIGTKPDATLYNIYITVISCQMFYR